MRRWTIGWTCAILATASVPHLLRAAPVPDEPVQAETLGRTADPVIVPGSDLAGMSGTMIRGLRMFAFRRGTPRVIPFQVDQRDSGNEWVWDAALHGGQTRDDQDAGKEPILDHNDVLVFLSRDLGDRGADVHRALLSYASATRTGPPRRILEIRVTAPDMRGRGWAYLASYDADPPPPSTVRYMHFSAESLRVTSPVYELRYSNEHVALLQDLRLDEHEILDRLKVRGRADIRLGPIHLPLRFDEEDVGGFIQGYINGPVRSVIRTVNYVHLPMGLRTPRVDCDHFYYPDYAEIPLLLSIRLLVRKATLRLTADYKGSPFRRAMFQGEAQPTRLPHGVRRGRLGPIRRQGRWMVLSGRRGTVISLLKLPEEVQAHGTASLYLLDDPSARNGPEAYAGSEPEAGFEITTDPGLPKGDYILYLVFYMSAEPYAPGREETILDLLEKPLSWSISRM